MRSTAEPAASTTARALRASSTMRRSSAAASSPSSVQVDGLHLVVADIGDDAAERRGHARIARHERSLQPDLLDQRAGMQRAAAAERHGGEAARDHARARSRRAGSRRPSCALATRTIASAACHGVEPERLCRHGSAIAAFAASTSSRASLPPIGRSALMRPSTTLASVSVGRVIALPVADRPRARAGAFRPDLEQPAAHRHGRSSRRRRRSW